MSKPSSTEKPDFISKIADYAGYILAVSVIAIIAAWSFYLFQFSGGLSDDTAIWGQFGDFVGGTLNSIFAFFSFVILLSSLRLQLKELRLTREELEATRQELAASSEAQRMQAEHFYREAKKKDHTDAISYILKHDIIGEDIAPLVVRKKYDQKYIKYNITQTEAPHKKEIENGDYEIHPAYIYGITRTIKKMEFFDHHCHGLWSIFPYSPTLITPISRYQNLILSINQKGWLNELKFFGKHNFPLT